MLPSNGGGLQAPPGSAARNRTALLAPNRVKLLCGGGLYIAERFGLRSPYSSAQAGVHRPDIGCSMAQPSRSIFDQRRDQTFPKLDPPAIERVRRFGDVRFYTAGERLMTAGQVAPGLLVVLAGSVAVTEHDHLDVHLPIVTYGEGDFLGELAQLAGRPALTDAVAEQTVEALIIPPERLRALMIAEAELGERIMRALILRRVALVEMGAGGPVLIGDETSPDIIRLQGFLPRNSYPNQVLDPAEDPDAKSLVERYAPRPGELPP